MENSEYDFLIAIDFGPLFCTSSFVSLQSEDQKVLDIGSWPKQKRSSNKKVPNAISYPSNDDQTSSSLFGFAAAEARMYIEKPLVCHISPDEINKPKKEKNPKKEKDPTADYLYYFHEHVKKYLADTQKHPFHLTSRARYCFTLQYTEKDYENNLKQVLEKSGIITKDDRIDKSIFVDKYLAISSYILATYKDLQKSDEFLICDISKDYLIVKRMKINENKEHRNIEEVKLSGNNRCNGNAYKIKINSLDASFSNFVGPKITAMMYGLELENGYNIENAVLESCRHFSKSLKKSFSRDDYGEYNIKLPLVIGKKKVPDTIPVKAEELKTQVFKPVSEEILQHVTDLVGDSQPKKIFLYGDFCNLEYITYEISNKFSQTILLEEYDTAASRGAIYYGLHEPLIIERMPPIKTKESQEEIKEDREFYDFNYDYYTHVVGIDFGTSNTKWYYADQKQKENVDFDFDKMFIPSLSLYDEKLDSQLLWGADAYKRYYESSKDGRLVTRFKLMLDEDSLRDSEQVTAIEAISTYLNVLHQKILLEMKNIAEEKNIRYCLTIPTIWSDSSKSVMRQAAILAGIINTHDFPSRLILVNEPEAAAIFYSKQKELEKIYKKKSRVLVVDAGGGTVDMGIYDFKKINNTYKINEVTIGSGKACGSSFLDDNFRELIKKKCYEIEYIAQSYTIEKMVEQFNSQTKKEFTSSTENDYYFTIHHVKGKEPEVPYLVVSPIEMQEKVFDPIVDEVLDLVKEQIERLEDKRNADVIILTGGLSQSKYLQEKLKILATDLGIPQVHSPEKYDQSVVRGAVALALEPSTITQRIARKSYGIETLSPFDRRLDPVTNRVLISDKEYCRQKFDLFSKIGSAIKTYEYVQHTYSVPYPKNTCIALYEHITADDINLTTDNRVKSVFYFNVDMPKIEGAQPGKMIELAIRLFLGQTEIKVDSIIAGKVITRHTFVFDAIDENARMEQEALHKKSPEQLKEPTIVSKKPNTKKEFLKYLASRLGRD